MILRHDSRSEYQCMEYLYYCLNHRLAMTHWDKDFTEGHSEARPTEENWFCEYYFTSYTFKIVKLKLKLHDIVYFFSWIDTANSPPPSCHFPDWLNGITWRDLSGQNRYTIDESMDTLFRSHRRGATSKDSIQSIHRCRRVLTKPADSDEHVFQTFSTHGWWENWNGFHSC